MPGGVLYEDGTKVPLSCRNSSIKSFNHLKFTIVPVVEGKKKNIAGEPCPIKIFPLCHVWLRRNQECNGEGQLVWSKQEQCGDASPRWPDYITSPSVTCQARELQLLALQFLSQKEKI
jgi:hypothetical protein